MKKETKLLLNSGIDSLLLSIEHFNRPWDKGRVVSVFMHLNHAFEMLLKAVILYKGGKIREKRAKETIGFEHCVRKCLSDTQLQCLTKEQALTLQMINSLRDAAEHYLLDITEEQFYMHVQSGVTLFGDILSEIFNLKLNHYMPERVLPISIKPPSDLHILMDEKIADIKKLIKRGKRTISDAKHKLRSLAIIENSIKGDSTQPSNGDLNRIIKLLSKNEDWGNIFPGVASVRLNTGGEGLNISLRIGKKEGVPIRLVKEGEGDGLPVAVKRVNELDFYSLSASNLAEKLRLTLPKTLALIAHFNIQGNEDFFKPIRVRSSIFKSYSQKALDFLKKELPNVDIDEIWKSYKNKIYKRKKFED
jgi:hypothetical protein